MLHHIVAAICILQLYSTSGNAVEEPTGTPEGLTVTTIVIYPYYFVNHKNEYVGYIPDLMQELSHKTNLTFNITLVKDYKYGQLLENGSWNGMVGEILNEVASMASAPLTVTDKRKTVVDFTTPFMHFDYSLILLKSDNEALNIRDVNDLLNQTDIKIGTLQQGSTFDFFLTSGDPVMRSLAERISSDPTNFERTTDSGTTRVRSGGYGFITTSDIAQCAANKSPCNLVVIPIVPDVGQYAIAVKKGSQLKEVLDEAIQQLKDTGRLEHLKKRWWYSNCSA